MNKIKIKTINPKEAQELLLLVPKTQRKILQARVNAYVSDLNAGRFALSWDAITIADGKLINGQHRLAAVVQSGIEADFLILEVESTDIWKVGDTGRSRKVADTLKYNEINYTSAIAAAGKLIASYQKLDKSFTSPTYILEVVNDNKKALEKLIEFINPLYHKTRLIPISIATAFLFLAKKAKQEESATKFISDLYTGTNLTGIALAINQKFQRDSRTIRTSDKFNRPIIKLRILVKCFNAHISNTMCSLSLKKDEIPSFTV